MVTKQWKVYGIDGHRQRESFFPSSYYDWSNESDGVRILEVINSDKTGTNEYSIIRITRNNDKECEDELRGQISDGVYENSRVGRVEEIKEKNYMKVYVHYGHKKFDPEMFKHVKNIIGRNKPLGGLWSSPEDGYGWKQWNESEHFVECDDDNCFRFTIDPSANILRIKTEYDVLKLPRLGDDLLYPKGLSRFMPLHLSIDFENLIERGIDAIDFSLNDETYYALYGWDCDTLFVMNHKIIHESR